MEDIERLIDVTSNDGAQTCLVRIHAVPGAGRDAVSGVHGDALKVRVRAKAQDGKANEALCAYLADLLGLRRRGVTVVSGAKSRSKLVGIALAPAELAKRLGSLVTETEQPGRRGH